MWAPSLDERTRFAHMSLARKLLDWFERAAF
jgi:hypothetical protein